MKHALLRESIAQPLDHTIITGGRTMECPQCGQAVLVDNGAITPHLDPHTLQLCSAEAKDEEPKAAKKAAAKKAGWLTTM